MRKGGVLNYLLSDHLGSTSVTLDANGQFVAELRYAAFGETRYALKNTPTDYRYTGQRQQAEIGLYYYGARWYDPALARFVSPDTVVPSAVDSQAYDRYAYSLNNPINHTDPTGHWPDWGEIGRDLYGAFANLTTNAAEWAHGQYVAAANFATEHPETIMAANYVVDAVDTIAGNFINKDPKTQGWGDLTADWAFEQGKTRMDFGANAQTTKDLMTMEGAHKARQLAMDSFCSGSELPVSAQAVYGKPEFLKGMETGDMKTSFLGTYSVDIDITPGQNGFYIFNYTARNVSGWASGTRLRLPAYPGGDHQSIIPDIDRGEGIHFGGNMYEYWHWSETVSSNQCPY